jgi:hypothetical protein
MAQIKVEAVLHDTSPSPKATSRKPNKKHHSKLNQVLVATKKAQISFNHE